jgi:Zn-dependent peptidase ImmA (M78 family)
MSPVPLAEVPMQVGLRCDMSEREPLWQQFKSLGVSPSVMLHVLDVTTPPVPIVQVAQVLGARVVPAKLDGHAGDLSLDAHGVPIIRYRESDAPTRARFTVAHEIAHLILHDGPQRRDMLVGNRKEVAANRFAAELLMPFYLLQDAIEEHGETNVERLAKLFYVSPKAMEIRLQMMAGLG